MATQGDLVENELEAKSQKKIKENKVKIAAKKDLGEDKPEAKSQNGVQNGATVIAEENL